MNKNHQKYLSGGTKAGRESFMSKLANINSDKDLMNKQSNLQQYNTQAAPNNTKPGLFGNLPRQSTGANSRQGNSGSNPNQQTGEFGHLPDQNPYNINQT